jgi:hypothetical protein
VLSDIQIGYVRRLLDQFVSFVPGPAPAGGAKVIEEWCERIGGAKTMHELGQLWATRLSHLGATLLTMELASKARHGRPDAPGDLLLVKLHSNAEFAQAIVCLAIDEAEGEYILQSAQQAAEQGQSFSEKEKQRAAGLTVDAWQIADVLSNTLLMDQESFRGFLGAVKSYVEGILAVDAASSTATNSPAILAPDGSPAVSDSPNVRARQDLAHVNESRQIGDEPAPQAQREEVILLIHGIRTQAEWQDMVAVVLRQIPNVVVVPLKYEFFDALRFWLPFVTRRLPISQLIWRIREARRQNPDARFSVIAHSFGTYAIAEILRDHPDITLHRLVLCGAVLKRNFRWDRIKNQVETEIINDCGMRDVWPVLAQSTTWGYGASGTFGFGSPGIRDRFHAQGHSGLFVDELVTRFWVPWFLRGTFIAGERPTGRPYLWSLLTVIQIKWLVLIAILLLSSLPHFSRLIRNQTNIPGEPSDTPVAVLPQPPDGQPTIKFEKPPANPDDLPFTSLEVANQTGRSIRIYLWPLLYEGQHKEDQQWSSFLVKSPEFVNSHFTGGCHFVVIEDALTRQQVRLGWREFRWTTYRKMYVAKEVFTGGDLNECVRIEKQH